MVEMIEKLTKEKKCKTIIDIGVGAGYVCHSLQLNSRNSFNVIGIEGNPSHSNSFQHRISSINQSIGIINTRNDNNNNNNNNNGDNKINDKKDFLMENNSQNNKNEKKKNEQSSSALQIENISIVNWFIDKNDPNLEEKFDEILSPSLPSLNYKKKSLENNINILNDNNVNNNDNNYEGEEEEEEERLALIGLHCCGDLSPAIIKLFSESKKSKVLLCISCCYSKLSLPSYPPLSSPLNHLINCDIISDNINDNNNNNNNNNNVRDKLKGFPMSEKLNELTEKYGLRIEKRMTELAAQCSFRWRNRTEERMNYETNTLAFRSILEAFFAPLLPAFYSLALCDQTTSKIIYSNFEIYLDFILPKLCMKKEGGNDGEVDTEEDTVEKIPFKNSKSKSKSKFYKLPFDVKLYRNDLIHLYFEKEKEFQMINIFHALKLTLQRIIESLIVLDRKLFLMENQIFDIEILPIFDENISPRNIALIAKR